VQRLLEPRSGASGRDLDREPARTARLVDRDGDAARVAHDIKVGFAAGIEIRLKGGAQARRVVRRRPRGEAELRNHAAHLVAQQDGRLRKVDLLERVERIGGRPAGPPRGRDRGGVGAVHRRRQLGRDLVEAGEDAGDGIVAQLPDRAELAARELPVDRCPVEEQARALGGMAHLDPRRGEVEERAALARVERDVSRSAIEAVDGKELAYLGDDRVAPVLERAQGARVVGCRDDRAVRRPELAEPGRKVRREFRVARVEGPAQLGEEPRHLVEPSRQPVRAHRYGATQDGVRGRCRGARDIRAEAGEHRVEPRGLVAAGHDVLYALARVGRARGRREVAARIAELRGEEAVDEPLDRGDLDAAAEPCRHDGVLAHVVGIACVRDVARQHLDGALGDAEPREGAVYGSEQGHLDEPSRKTRASRRRQES